MPFHLYLTLVSLKQWLLGPCLGMQQYSTSPRDFAVPDLRSFQLAKLSLNLLSRGKHPDKALASINDLFIQPLEMLLVGSISSSAIAQSRSAISSKVHASSHTEVHLQLGVQFHLQAPACSWPCSKFRNSHQMKRGKFLSIHRLSREERNSEQREWLTHLKSPTQTRKHHQSESDER